MIEGPHAPADDRCPSEVDIAIVGAGASGLLCLAQLARHSADGRRLRVALIDPAPTQAVGIAYSTRRIEHLMNVRACRLSAFTDQPLHFVEWMAARGSTIEPNGFARRRDYGRYLQSVAGHARHGMSVHRIGLRCDGLDAAGHLLLSDGSVLHAGQVVLALGNARPRPLDGPRSVVIDGPWDEEALGRIRPDDDVLIVGSGLTAVDVLLTLHADGHTGRTTIISRHGRWPAAHAPVHVEDAVHWTVPLVDESRPPTARALVRAVRLALRDPRNEWHAVVDDVRPHTVQLWHALDDVERSRFARHGRALWEIHRHRMSPPIADGLDTILGEGRATLAAAHVERIEESPDGRASVTTRGEGGDGRITARWVINCTGPTADIRRRTDPLVHALLYTGLGSPGWHGWGFDLDDLGRLRDRTGASNARISVIGPLRLGADYESVAIPEIRTQAAALAARLAASAQPSRNMSSATSAAAATS